MTTSRWAQSILAMIAASAVACSSSSGGTTTTAKGDGGSSTSGGSAASCAESIAGSGGEACSACVESSCASELASAESGCSALFSCVCPSGTFDESLVTGCESEAEEGSCSSAGEALAACSKSTCSSACGSSSGGTDAGGSTGGTMNVSCTEGTAGSSLSCTIYFETEAQLAMEKMMECMEINGAVGTECPSTENSVPLTGCCKSTESNDEECYYNSAETEDAMSCTMAGGTWSTKQ